MRQRDGAVPNSQLIDFLASRQNAVTRFSFKNEITENLPELPVLPETLLAMELQDNGNSVDLRGFSEAVLGDVGATLLVLRRIGQEYGDCEDRPIRIEDCIADLGIDVCMHLAMQGMRERAANLDNIVEIWGHSTEIARQCDRLAEEFGINPCQAYLAGLLHDIGALPGVLGWGPRDFAGDYTLSALKMAVRWCFPDFLKEYFYEAYLPGKNRNWTAMMAAAHDAASQTWAWCPLNELNVSSLARLSG